jgi:hypothetical protein
MKRRVVREPWSQRGEGRWTKLESLVVANDDPIDNDATPINFA